MFFVILIINTKDGSSCNNLKMKIIGYFDKILAAL